MTLVSMTIRNNVGTNVPEARGFGEEPLAHVFHATARVVHQDVEPTEPREGRLHHARAVLLARDVGRERQHAFGPALGGNGLYLLRFARRRDRDATPGARESERHRPPKPTPAAGDHRNATRDQATILTRHVSTAPSLLLRVSGPSRQRGLDPFRRERYLTDACAGGVEDGVGIIRTGVKLEHAKWAHSIHAGRRRRQRLPPDRAAAISPGAGAGRSAPDPAARAYTSQVLI